MPLHSGTGTGNPTSSYCCQPAAWLSWSSGVPVTLLTVMPGEAISPSIIGPTSMMLLEPAGTAATATAFDLCGPAA